VIAFPTGHAVARLILVVSLGIHMNDVSHLSLFFVTARGRRGGTFERSRTPCQCS